MAKCLLIYKAPAPSSQAPAGLGSVTSGPLPLPCVPGAGTVVLLASLVHMQDYTVRLISDMIIFPEVPLLYISCFCVHGLVFVFFGAKVLPCSLGWLSIH